MDLTRTVLVVSVLLGWFSVMFVEAAPARCNYVFNNETLKAIQQKSKKPKLIETQLKFRLGNSAKDKYEGFNPSGSNLYIRFV